MNDIKNLLNQIAKEFHLVNDPFEKALFKEDIGEVKKLIKKGEKLNAHYTMGLTPLHFAIRMGRSVNFTKELLELGANPNVAEKREGRSPLYDAAWSENEPLVTLLLEYGANPNIADKDGWTPLFCSAWRGHESITKTLLTHRANKNARDIYRKTPLVKAKENGQFSVQNVLQTFINTYPPSYKELVRKIRKGDSQALEAELAAGFPVNMSNDKGETLLFHAIKERNMEMIELLLMYGAKVNRFDYKGLPPLIQAIKTKKQEIVYLLLDYDANPGLEAKKGLSAIELAKINENDELLEVLNEQLERILTPLEVPRFLENFELERHEIEILSQDLMQDDIIMDRSITPDNVRIDVMLPRSEMGENIVVSVKEIGEDRTFPSRPNIEIPYGKKLKVSRYKI